MTCPPEIRSSSYVRAVQVDRRRLGDRRDPRTLEGGPETLTWRVLSKNSVMRIELWHRGLQQF